jgi:hypothetical protein
MSSVKPKRRRKIPYIGEPLTASEIRASYPPLTPEMQAIVDRNLAKLWEKRDPRRRTKRPSAKTVRAK